MHFEFSPWDCSSIDSSLFNNRVVVFNFFDPFFERLALKKLWRDKFDLNNSLNRFADDITTSWMQDNLLTLSLFSSGDSYFIWNCEKLGKSDIDFFFENCLEDIGGNRVFFSSTKVGNLFHKAVKSDVVTTIKVNGPKYWEEDKYFDFLANEMKVRLSSDIRSFLLDNLTHNSCDFISTLKLIRDCYPSKKDVSIDQVKELVNSINIDKFEIVKILGKGNIKGFYKKLLKIGDDFSQIRQIIVFGQSYLTSLLDPSYLENKNYLSKYDKEILASSKIWKKEDLLVTIQRLLQLEILAKRSANLLLEELRCNCL